MLGTAAGVLLIGLVRWHRPDARKLSSLMTGDFRTDGARSAQRPRPYSFPTRPPPRRRTTANPAPKAPIACRRPSRRMIRTRAAMPTNGRHRVQPPILAATSRPTWPAEPAATGARTSGVDSQLLYAHEPTYEPQRRTRPSQRANQPDTSGFAGPLPVSYQTRGGTTTEEQRFDRWIVRGHRADHRLGNA